MENVSEHNYFKDCNLITKKGIFGCSMCNATFKHGPSLYNHLKRVHKVKNTGSRNIKCHEEECHERFNQLKDLEVHLSKKHLKKIEKQKLFFKSLDEFKTWRREMEKATESQYASYTRGKATQPSTLYFKCGRSGVYKERLTYGTRKRKLKAQGSKKSGVHCISRMIVHMNDSSGQITVNFCNTHYGHNNELKHVTLNKIEKDKIAASLMEGVSANAILDEVRNSITDNKIERIHLLTKKDIRNIGVSYGLIKTVDIETNDVISAGIKEVESSGQGPGILHKNQGETEMGFLAEDVTKTVINNLEEGKKQSLLLMQSLAAKLKHVKSLKKLTGVINHLRCARSLIDLDSEGLLKETSPCQVVQEHPPKKKIELKGKHCCHSTKRRKLDISNPLNQVKKRVILKNND